MSRQATRLPRPDPRSAFAVNLDVALASTTSEKFARRVDTTLRTVQRWRSGESEPKGEVLLRVARELGTTVEALFEPAEQPSEAA